MTFEHLEAEFHKEMLAVYERARQATRSAYRPERFRRLVDKVRGLEAAKRLLRSESSLEGLMKLWEHGCLHLSMEALVLEKRWEPLFTDEERAIAARRLQEFGYTASGPGSES